MIRLCEKEKCTGCMACYNICKFGAITICTDKQGFEYPQINTNKCKECGCCTKVCPIINVETDCKSLLETYAAWNKNSSILNESSSGGFFSAIAESFIKQNGYVIGAAFDKNFNVNHIIINDTKELYRLRGSKYVQSSINDIYKNVKHILKQDSKVLFSGTPCQISGLKSYLKGTNISNLYTIDLVCHGVPSPLIFLEYKKWLESKYKSQINEFTFRNKKWSWIRYNTKVTFNNGSVYYGKWEEDIYTRGFLRDLYLRESCYNCKFTNLNRVGDITIADFWGYKQDKDEIINKDEGVSLVIINTLKGKEAFDICKDQLVYYRKDIEIAIKGNNALSKQTMPANERDNFWKDYYETNFNTIIKKYLYPDYINYYNKVLYKYGRGNFRLTIIGTVIKLRVFIRKLKKKIIS